MVITGNNIININNKTLTKALEVTGFENATVWLRVATHLFNNRLSSFGRLDTTALDNLCTCLLYTSPSPRD